MFGSRGSGPPHPARLKHGNQWERAGKVLARPARPGETVHTLEGPVTALDGDFVVQGDKGEQWPVPGDEFRRRYRGPVPVYDLSKVSMAAPEPGRV